MADPIPVPPFASRLPASAAARIRATGLSARQQGCPPVRRDAPGTPGEVGDDTR